MDIFAKLVLGLKPEPQDVKLLVLLCVMFFMLRDEIRTNKIMDVADKKVIEFRLDALENKKHLAILERPKEAIMPQYPKLTSDAEQK
jgi:hypothetical protein